MKIEQHIREIQEKVPALWVGRFTKEREQQELSVGV